MTRALWASACLLLVGACVTKSADPFVNAQRALRRHDLAMALQALDSVPVAHVHYPQARASALEVERSMRQCHELMLQAMLLRSEWRDREALVALQQASTLWPEAPGISVLIAATQQRLLVLGERTPVQVESSVPAAPLLEAPLLEAPPAAAAPTPGPTVSPTVPMVPTQPAVRSVANAEDPVALGLVAVEMRLGRGQLEMAVVDLLELARCHPRDQRVRVRLVRLLHQRALLRYGEGSVAMAISDWRRVLELDPHHATAQQQLEVAEREGR